MSFRRRGDTEVTMKRSWNWPIWAGFLLAVAGLFSYVPIFAQFPLTRDFPWVNLLMLAGALALLGLGLTRAYRRPDAYRGRVFGPALALLSLVGIGFFCWGLFYAARQLPASSSSPRVGQKAPDFVLPDQDGKPVALADLISSPPAGPQPSAGGVKPAGALLIFYRGYW
jgi:hypothetical protein